MNSAATTIGQLYRGSGPGFRRLDLNLMSRVQRALIRKVPMDIFTNSKKSDVKSGVIRQMATNLALPLFVAFFVTKNPI